MYHICIYRIKKIILNFTKLYSLDIIRKIIRINKKLNHFKISNHIQNLNTQDIESNLAYYKYDTRKLSRQIHNKIDQELPEFISTYSSFKGEVYENILYELLLRYAKEEEAITRFILKGPHQNKNNIYNKQGLLIDKSAQIVYKSAYKDISEFDALFFTKDEIYFVEMSTSKKTASLNKRLNKKYALLKVLFPSLEIRALIILTQGSVGLKRFPPYATIWLTKELDDKVLLNKILNKQLLKKDLITYENTRFIETDAVRYKRFQYLQTLEWILNKSREHKHFVVDLKFFTSSSLSLYFDIFTKLYIGYMENEEFLQLAPSYPNDIKKVIVTIEKVNSKTFDTIYYVRDKSGKLMRVAIDEESKELSIKQKEIDGFTNAETKFLTYVLKDEHVLLAKDIHHLKKNISIIV